MKLIARVLGWSGALCASAALLTSCGKGGDTYRLFSVDGKSVPIAVTHEGNKLEIRSGRLTFNNDGTCVSRIVYAPTSGKEGVKEVSATYSRTGSKVDMQWKGAGKTSGTFQDSTFTMNNEGMIFVFQK